MVFKQNIDNCFEEKIGSNGISKAQLDEAIKIMLQEVDALKSEKLKLFDFSDIREKHKSVKNLVKELREKYKHLYILGTGGATLCGQTIFGLLENHRKKSRVKFIDNIDSRSFELLKKQIKLPESCVLVISKSGSTLETITQFAFFTNLYEESLGRDKIKDHFLVITDTDNENNKIRNIAKKFGINIYPHEKVGGRFSIFSAVGLIPASFARLKTKEFLKGAKDEVDRTFKKKDSQSIIGAALNYALVEHKKTNATVMMPYIDRLKNFTTWWAQIWAESLGKNDIATTPIRSLGTLDQHSQMQLFLQGKKDKFFNVMYINESGSEPKINLSEFFKQESLSYLDGKNFSNVMNSAARATIETLALNKSPVRVFEIDYDLDEYTLGCITMHFILETVLLAKAWKLNPFDQPAVEQGKKLTIEMLKSL
jgi:glucose-6-phosphate isomerase